MQCPSSLASCLAAAGLPVAPLTIYGSTCVGQRFNALASLAPEYDSEEERDVREDILEKVTGMPHPLTLNCMFDATGIPENRPDLMACERKKFRDLCDKMVREGVLTRHGTSYALSSTAKQRSA